MTLPASAPAPDPTAVRVALWRALHLDVDAPPPVLEDRIGLQLVAPEEGWRQRPDMDPAFTRPVRASMVGRARFVEDQVAEQAARGIGQYVLLGSGLDTFAQRKAEIASRLHLFEVDRPGPLEWKRRRLTELGFSIPDWLHLVPVDFESGESWRKAVALAGFDPQRPAIAAAIGLSMYLTRDAVETLVGEVARLARGSTLVMTFQQPLHRLDPEDRPVREMAEHGAQAMGAPFLSFYTPPEILALAQHAGFPEARTVSAPDLTQRYFAARPDGLRPSSAEVLLVAST